ncbi:MAG: hypothetical protein Unbinned5081contig1002_53 [Prokaryotic dsDNA virus sp.]|nr:MAG: hypothetical protein Unbinned5081contig1002_53 [Prokaryotic dsDNA virus sp.]|tara:strand:+ start:18887 stop:19534 length:648 start_codon:yes stop_codon:yes gene_type:complete
MADLDTIRNRVARKIQDPDFTGSLTSAVVTDEINRSIRYYEKYRFNFNEAQSDITLTANTQVVPNIPSDLSSPLYVNGLMLIDSQVKITLQKLNPTDFFNKDQDQTGRPYWWTYRNGEFLILPTPQEAYTLKFRYLKTYTALSTGTDTNDFTDNAEDLILLHTVKNIYAEDKQDPQSAAYYQSLEDAELKAVRERSNYFNSSGYLDNNTILYEEF